MMEASARAFRDGHNHHVHGEMSPKIALVDEWFSAVI
jgi:hypothetical protein